MFLCLHVALSVWAACVREGKCVEIACLQTLMHIDFFFLPQEESQRSSKQFCTIMFAVYAPFYQLYVSCSISRETEKAIETVVWNLCKIPIGVRKLSLTSACVLTETSAMFFFASFSPS